MATVLSFFHSFIWAMEQSSIALGTCPLSLSLYLSVPLTSSCNSSSTSWPTTSLAAARAFRSRARPEPEACFDNFGSSSHVRVAVGARRIWSCLPTLPTSTNSFYTDLLESRYKDSCRVSATQVFRKRSKASSIPGLCTR